MHDRLSAKHYKLTPRGNGRRESFACAPMPRMNEHHPHGRSARSGRDPEERQARIFAKKFGGGQVDISNGDFVFSLTESYLVEDGKINGAAQGREPDRQRPRRPPEGLDARQRRRDVGRHLDLRQGRAKASPSASAAPRSRSARSRRRHERSRWGGSPKMISRL